MDNRASRLITAPTPERSRLLARVRREGTAPELMLRRQLHRAGFRYRLRYPLPGSPDLVLVSAKLAVFVDGCFWHGCPDHGTTPKTNTSFWRAKIERNKERDKSVDRQLTSLGWTAIRVWEHEVTHDLERVVARITETEAASRAQRLTPSLLP